MKLTVNPAICVELLPHDHSLIISTDEAVIIRCTLCGGIKDMMCFLQSLPISYAPNGHRWCHGHDEHNAPNNGGDTYVQKLLAFINTMLGQCKTIDDARTLIVGLATEEQEKRKR